MRAGLLPALTWLASLALPASAGVASAQPSLVASSGSARTLPRERLEVGVFAPTRYGLDDGVELTTQPLLLPLMPQLGAKAAWWTRAPVTLASRTRLSYPTPLLDTLAREGDLGLLPPTSDVPQAIIVDADALCTLQWVPGHVLTGSLGASVAPRGSSDAMPLLDFPFLYARFAVLKTTAVYRIGVDYEAQLGAYFRLATDAKLFFLPVIDGGFSLEPGVALRWLAARHFALEAGARFEYAKFPAGAQFHYLPFVDALFAW